MTHMDFWLNTFVCESFESNLLNEHFFESHGSESNHNSRRACLIIACSTKDYSQTFSYWRWSSVVARITCLRASISSPATLLSLDLFLSLASATSSPVWSLSTSLMTWSLSLMISLYSFSTESLSSFSFSASFTAFSCRVL